MNKTLSTDKLYLCDAPVDVAEGIWKQFGGKFHGPNIEHGTIKKEDLMKMLNLFYAMKIAIIDANEETKLYDGHNGKYLDLIKKIDAIHKKTDRNMRSNDYMSEGDYQSWYHL